MISVVMGHTNRAGTAMLCPPACNRAISDLSCSAHPHFTAQASHFMAQPNSWLKPASDCLRIRVPNPDQAWKEAEEWGCRTCWGREAQPIRNAWARRLLPKLQKCWQDGCPQIWPVFAPAQRCRKCNTGLRPMHLLGFHSQCLSDFWRAYAQHSRGTWPPVSHCLCECVPL